MNHGCAAIKESFPLFELNRSVARQDAPRLSRQALEIYRLLKACEVSTGQMSAIACQYNARLYEIRHALAVEGKTVALVRKGEGGNNWYRISELKKEI